MPKSLQDLRNQLPSWPSPPDKPSLGATDVHVFRASLEPAGHVAACLGQLLSRDEHARADRFHFEIDRQHFIVARGYLRKILARYMGIAPAGIRFSYADHGKPRLASPIGQTQPLHFNLAHSGGLALYAFTRVGEIGIDLEHIRPDFSGEDTARRFFSTTEVTCLSQLPGARVTRLSSTAGPVRKLLSKRKESVSHCRSINSMSRWRLLNQPRSCGRVGMKAKPLAGPSKRSTWARPTSAQWLSEDTTGN